MTAVDDTMESGYERAESHTERPTSALAARVAAAVPAAARPIQRAVQQMGPRLRGPKSLSISTTCHE